jgi:hypothetical protein
MFGATLPTNAAIVISAVFSHYLLDALPHIDPDTFAKEKGSYNWKQSIVLVIDAISVITFAFALYHYQERWFPVLLGGVAAQLPDLLIPLEKYDWYAPFAKIHKIIHWDKRQAHNWNWYIAGFISQIAVSAISLALIVTQ